MDEKGRRVLTHLHIDCVVEQHFLIFWDSMANVAWRKGIIIIGVSLGFR
jgi:hypothetical protein